MFNNIISGFGYTIGAFVAICMLLLIGTLCSPSFRNGFREAFRKAQEKRQVYKPGRIYPKERGH